MSRRSCLHLFAVAFFLPAPCGPTSAAAHRPRTRRPPPSRPLPPAAVTRMGTTRFRHSHPVSSIAFVPGGKVLISAGLLR